MQAVDVAVIGGGITGLVLGERLSRSGVDALVFERTGRPGGVIRTRVHDEVVYEQGPVSLRGTSPVVASWLRGLEISPLGADPAAKRRFILRKGRLVEAPSTGLLRKRDWVRLLAEPLVPGRTVETESLYDFVCRRFGAATARELVDPVIAGIFGGDPRELDPCVFPILREYEERYGSVMAGVLRARTNASGLPRVMTVRGGLERLVVAAANRVANRLVLNTPVTEVVKEAKDWVVRGPDVRAEKVVVCVPPAAAAEFVAEAGLSFGAVSPLAAVTLSYDPGAVKPEGFGWLAPSHERRDVLGVIWVSSVFPSHAPGTTLLRVMMGGTRSPRLVDAPEEVLVARARRVLAEVQGVEVTPREVDVVRVCPGIPQYGVGHPDWLRRLARSGLHFAGWGYTGIGLSHCIETAVALADQLTGARSSAGS